MAYQFASYAKTWASPFSRAVALSATQTDIEPTRAIMLRVFGDLTVVFADSETSVTLFVGRNGDDLILPFSIKRVVSFIDNNGGDAFTLYTDPLIGFY